MKENSQTSKLQDLYTSVLVTGARGMLGQDLCPILEDAGYEVIETDVDTLDITNTEQVKQVISEKNPDVVIHCAAYTNVDKAEEDLKTAELINVTGTENIADVCGKLGITMVYISTDYVFGGLSKTEPYKPSDMANPLNNYGITKFEGEEAVRSFCEKYYIARTSWLYGHHGRNFVETMIKAAAGAQPESACESKPNGAKHDDTAVATEAKAKGAQQSLIAQAEKAKTLKVVDDQVGCPTWTVELANGILKLLDNKPYGTYHVCGSGSTSWYGFAKEIFNQMSMNVDLRPCKTDEYPRPAKRPAYSVMDNDGICRKWEVALKDYLELRIEE